jgi:hypothetical protein
MRGQCGQIAAQFIEQRVESRKSSGISPHGDSDQLVCIGRAIVYFRVAGVLHAFMNARYQDPVRGQFISEDPAIVDLNPNTGLAGAPNTATVDAFLNGSGQTSSAYLNDPQALNLYSYGRDNPLAHTDPTGRLTIDLSYNFVRELGANLGVGGAAGARIELWPSVGIQFYTGGSVGVGDGATLQARFYPYGTLDPQGQYDSVEAVGARGLYGGAVSRDADVAGQRPITALVNSGDTSIGFAVGVQTSVTYSHIYLHKPKYLFNWTPASTQSHSSGGGSTGQILPGSRGASSMFYGGGTSALSTPSTNGLPPPPPPPPPPRFGFGH